MAVLGTLRENSCGQSQECKGQQRAHESWKVRGCQGLNQDFILRTMGSHLKILKMMIFLTYFI